MKSNKLNRVVITGVGAVSPFGNNVDSLMEGIRAGRSAVRYLEELSRYAGLCSHVAAPVQMQDEKKIPRQKRRSMSPMSIFAVQAAEQALLDSGITLADIPPGRAGCIVGSTIGSSQSINELLQVLMSAKDVHSLPSTLFFKCMSHTAAMNVAQYLGLTGYVMSTAAACASSLQAIGTGYSLIKSGCQDVLFCGGAEELHPMVTGTFDVLFATSVKYNDQPAKTPRPFDADRDGLVCGEGSGMIVLESYEHAMARNARIYAEISGYNTCSSAVHISQSDKQSIAYCIKAALADAQTSPDEIDYINAHATGTVQGDKEEADAIREIFKDSVLVSSLKGYIGHTMGASGAIELVASLLMMATGVIYPGLNLDNIGTDCQGINHIKKPTRKEIKKLLKNSFAFGGINAALVCEKIHTRLHSK